MQLFDTGEPVVLSFATPIFQHRWPAAEIVPVNAGLKTAILARRACSPGTQVSNIGGWQSTHDLMSWDVPELKQLGTWINQAFGAVMSRELGTKAFQYRYAVNAWANVNENGDYNRSHSHPNNHWSGVYYVDTGEPDPEVVPNGAIEFIDPRPAADVFEFPGAFLPATWTLQPESGTMLMFPSWLRHGVLPYFGKGPRISIAFNLCVSELSLQTPSNGR
jgi:uncharacterized protein (TIGR02466 family)